MSNSADAAESMLAPSALGLGYLEAGSSTKRLASIIVETLLSDYSAVILNSFSQLRDSIHNRPLYIMMEPSLGCDPMHDHEAPKDVSPLFGSYIDRAESQILTLPTSILKLKLEEQIVQLLKELSSENADLQRQLDNVRSLLTDSHVQVSNKDSLMSSILKSKSDEKVRLLSEIQLLREQLYQKRIHGGVNIYKPDFGHTEGGHGDADERDAREFWNLRLKDKDDEILQLNKQIVSLKEEVSVLKGFTKDSMDEAERHRLEALSKSKASVSLEDENALLKRDLEELQMRYQTDMNAATTSIEALRTENTTLSKAAEEQEAEASTMRHKMETLESKALVLEAQLTEAKQRHMQDTEVLRRELERANAAATSAKDDLKKHAIVTDRLKAELEMLMKENGENSLVSGLKDQIEKQQKDISKLVSDIKIYRGKLAHANNKIAKLTGRPVPQRKALNSDDSNDFTDDDLYETEGHGDTDNLYGRSTQDTTIEETIECTSTRSSLSSAQLERVEDSKKSDVDKMAALIGKYREIVCCLARLPDAKLPKTLAGLSKFLSSRMKKADTANMGEAFDPANDSDSDSHPRKKERTAKAKQGKSGKGIKGPKLGGNGKSASGGKGEVAVKRKSTDKNVTPAKASGSKKEHTENSDSDSYYYSYSISSNDTYLLEDKIDDDFFGVGGDPNAMVRRGDVEEYVSMKIQAALENFRMEYDNEAELQAMGIAHMTAKAILENYSHRSCQTYVSYLTDTMRILTDADIIDENDGLYLDDAGNWRRIGDVAVKSGLQPKDIELNRRRLDLFNHTSMTNLPLADPNHPLHRRDAQLAMTAADKVMNLQATGANYRLHHNLKGEGLTTDQIFDQLYNDTQRMRLEANTRREKMDSTSLQQLKLRETPSPYREVAQADHKIGLFGSLIVKASVVPENATSPSPAPLNVQLDKKTPGAPSAAAVPSKSNTATKSGERVIQTINNVLGMNVASVKVDHPEEPAKPKKPMLVQQRFDPRQRRGTSTKEVRSHQSDRVIETSKSQQYEEDKPRSLSPLSQNNLDTPIENTVNIISSARSLHSPLTACNDTRSEPQQETPDLGTPRAFRLVNSSEADGIYVRMSNEGVINGQIIVSDGFVTNISYKNMFGDNLDRVIYSHTDSQSGGQLTSSPGAPSHNSIAITKGTCLPNNIIQSPELNIDTRAQLPKYDADQGVSVQPTLFIETVVEDGDSGTLRTTGDDSIRPSIDLTRTPLHRPPSGAATGAQRNKLSIASEIDMGSISEIQKLSISVPSTLEHNDLADQLPLRGSLIKEDLEQIHVADVTTLLGKNVVDFQRAAMLDQSGPDAAPVSTQFSEDKGAVLLDESLLRILSLLPTTPAEDEFLSLPRAKSCYKKQREKDLLAPGAALRLVKITVKPGHERLIEIITKPDDTPYFYDPKTEYRYSDIHSLQESLQQEQQVDYHPNTAQPIDRSQAREDSSAMHPELDNSTMGSEENSRVSLQLEPDGPEISIKSLANTADEQIRQLFKLTVDKHGRPRRLTEAELYLLSKIGDYKSNSTATIRLQRGNNIGQRPTIANLVSINETSNLKTQDLSENAHLRKDPVASAPHSKTSIELTPDELVSLYLKKTEEKQAGHSTRAVVGHGLQSRPVKIAPQVSSIPVTARQSLEGQSDSSFIGKYVTVDGKVIEYTEEDQFVTELDRIVNSMVSTASATNKKSDDLTTDDLMVLQTKIRDSATLDSKLESRIQSIRHIQEQLTKGVIKVVRADDGSRLFMDSRGFVLNGAIVEDMLKEEPDKLCTQLDILASLASSELQSHGLLNGIKVRNKNGTIEADLLLPRMPIQTIKESTSSTRLRSDHSTAQPIMTTDGLFNSSYYLDLSTNNSKLQTTPPGNSLVSMTVSTLTEDGHIGVQMPQTQIPHRASTSGAQPGQFVARNMTRSIVRSQLGTALSTAASSARGSPGQILKPLRSIEGVTTDGNQQPITTAGRTIPMQRVSGEYRDSDGLRFVKSSASSALIRGSKGSLVDDSEAHAYIRGGVVSHGVAEILSYSKQNSHSLQPGAVAREVGLPEISPTAAHALEEAIICRGISFKRSTEKPSSTASYPLLNSNPTGKQYQYNTTNSIKPHGEFDSDGLDSKLLTCSIIIDSPISPVQSYRQTSAVEARSPFVAGPGAATEKAQGIIEEVSDIQV